MKELIIELVQTVVTELSNENVIPSDASYKINIDATKDKAHGDYASNIGLVLAKQAKMPPRALAEQIVEKITAQNNASVDKIEIAGPGFINFFMSSASSFAVLSSIIENADKYGHNNSGKDQKVQVEFVSANPTGPLHVGHGRGAAVGDSICRLLG
ncbi:arginine--tRNA ligase, partial [Oleiphilus sp. HI0086]